MIVVTGATGSTGRRVTEILLLQLGADPFVGNVEVVASMTRTFSGASALYSSSANTRVRQVQWCLES
jgi:uncharacterized protein YbjT (DUF2867 family)